ncbi:MAG: heme-binding protein [Bryobacterales bacterium]|nr:heme-binding protein [Bryobacterales bacterium]
MLTILTRLALASLVLTGAAFAQDLIPKRVLSLDAAKKIAAAADEHARKNNWNVVIAVLDEGGHLLYLQRMTGVQVGSIEVAMRKAESAFKFKRPTKAFSDAAANRTAILVLPGAMPFEGGLPLSIGNDVIGAIGVSGVTAEQDGMIAQAGAEALAKMVR